jgi:hypothetical protein
VVGNKVERINLRYNCNGPTERRWPEEYACKTHNKVKGKSDWTNISLESTFQPSIVWFELKPNQYALIFKQHVDSYSYDTNNEYLAEAQDFTKRCLVPASPVTGASSQFHGDFWQYQTNFFWPYAPLRYRGWGIPISKKIRPTFCSNNLYNLAMQHQTHFILSDSEDIIVEEQMFVF